MPTPALLLVIATLLPLASFTLLVFIGKRMGNPLAGWVATCAIAGSFVCSLVATMLWLGGAPDGREWGAGKVAISVTMPWLPVGGGLGQEHANYLDLGVYVDSLTVLMFDMVTLISSLIFVFSIGYMREDKRFPRFFTYLSLFGFSMLGLVLGGTIVQLFVFWELVGLCSYLLIGFWYEKKSASNAAIKAFVTNRIGDFGFLIGFGILFYHVGNATLPHLWTMLNGASTDGPILLSNGPFSASLLTVMGIGLFFGAVGKSAQFPLHVWLPDAMEGPTPVSALIHAATMVAAGVYLVGRIFPILTPSAKLFIAIIGCTTLTMAALIAIAQSDIKKVLAYSTLSQLGYMILAMGVGSWVGGLFHLITHAFFKALLFLGSGSVIDAAHHEQEMTQYGGLMRKIPVTAITFGIAVLAIAGTPFFSGFYSKDMILAHAGAFAFRATGEEHHSAAYKLLFILPAIIAYVTAFYMSRCWMLTFWGKPRNQHLYDHAKERPIMYGPLVVLAIMSVIAGYGVVGVRKMLTNAQKESNAYCVQLKTKLGQTGGELNAFGAAWPVETEEHEAATAAEPAGTSKFEPALKHGEDDAETFLLWGWAFVVGIGIGVLIYLRGYAVADRLFAITPLRWIHTWLYRRMYFDELYFTVFVALTVGLAKVSGWFDRVVVDGLVNLAAFIVERLSALAGLNDKYVVDGAVNGAADVAQGLGAAVRAPQTGRIRMYVTILMLAVAIGLAVSIFVVLML